MKYKTLERKNNNQVGFIKCSAEEYNWAKENGMLNEHMIYLIEKEEDQDEEDRNLL